MRKIQKEENNYEGSRALRWYNDNLIKTERENVHKTTAKD